MYINLPGTGKRVLLEMEDSVQILELLQERLVGAGGSVVAQGSADLVMRLVVTQSRPPGVSASYWWLSGAETRRTSAALTRAVAEECGLPDLGTRVSLAARGTGIPNVEVLVTHSGAVDDSFQDWIAEGLFRGLLTAWNEAPSEAADPWGNAVAKPMVTTAPEELDDEPRIVLFPDPSVVLAQTGVSSAEPAPEKESSLTADNERDTEHVSDDAESEPQPEAEFASVAAAYPASPGSEQPQNEVVVLEAESTLVLRPDPKPASDFQQTPVAAPIPQAAANTYIPKRRPQSLSPFQDPRILAALGQATVFEREFAAPTPQPNAAPASSDPVRTAPDPELGAPDPAPTAPPVPESPVFTHRPPTYTWQPGFPVESAAEPASVPTPASVRARSTPPARVIHHDGTVIRIIT